jgi:hypothetical protein
MKFKKWLFSGLAGFVVMSGLSYLWYQVLTVTMHKEGFQAIARDPMLTPWLLVGYLVLAFVMAGIYPVGYKGGAPAKEGLVFGLLIGLVTGSQ